MSPKFSVLRTIVFQTALTNIQRLARSHDVSVVRPAFRSVRVVTANGTRTTNRGRDANQYQKLCGRCQGGQSTGTRSRTEKRSRMRKCPLDLGIVCKVSSSMADITLLLKIHQQGGWSCCCFRIEILAGVQCSLLLLPPFHITITADCVGLCKHHRFRPSEVGVPGANKSPMCEAEKWHQERNKEDFIPNIRRECRIRDCMTACVRVVRVENNRHVAPCTEYE